MELLGKQLANMHITRERDVKQNENVRLRQAEYGSLLRKGSSRSWLEEVGWLRCNKNNNDNSIFSPIKQRKLDPLNSYSQLQSPDISPRLLTPHRRCRESARMQHRSLYTQRNRMSNRSQSRMPLQLPFCDPPIKRSASCPSHLMHYNKMHQGSEHSRRTEYLGSEHSRRREYPVRGSNLTASHQSNTSSDVRRRDSKSFRGNGGGLHRHQSNADFGRKQSAHLRVQGNCRSHAIKAVSPTGTEVSCGQSEEKQPIMFLQLTTEGDVEKIKTAFPSGQLDLPHYTYPRCYEDCEKAETAQKNEDTMQLERFLEILKKRQCVDDGDRSHPRLVQLDALRLKYPDSVADVQKLEELHFSLLESEESLFWEKLECLKSKYEASLSIMIHCDIKQINEARRKLMEIKQIHLDSVRVDQARDALMNIVTNFSKPRAA